MSYTLIKSLHIIGVVAWFAGLFYIFRLYVYHTENKDKKDICDLLEIMERRLYRAITTPAMIWTLCMGLGMLFLNPDLLKTSWFKLKLAALLPLFGYHFFSGYTRKRFKDGDFFLSSKQCRMINEVPTLVLIIVVVLAVTKPFF